MHQLRFLSDAGCALRKARREAGLGQAALARQIGLSVPSIRQAERGTGSLDTFERVAGRLGLRLDGDIPPGGSLGARLSAARARRGWSRRTLAEVAGISATTIASVETGAPPNLATAARMAEAMGVRLRLLPRGTPSFWSAAGTSSVHHGWTTPPEILDHLYEVVGGGFDLDPCSPSRRGPGADVRARLRYTVEDNGLALPWRGATFLNPPYGRELRLWVSKARREAEEGRAAPAIALVPARTDTAWWHRDIVGRADVWLLRGRLAFGDGRQPAPFASALVAWSADDGHRNRMSAAFPEAWHIPAR